MNSICNYFKNKKITVMGLGLLGRGVGDAKFLAQCGAKLIVTDLKTKEQLKSSIAKLKKFPGIKYRLDEHRLEDFRNRNFILKAAGVPLDSPFIAEARKNKIPVEMSASLFARLSKATIVGITGTRGKSTTTHLIHHVLKESGRNAFLGGNVKGVSTLAFLGKVKSSDIAVLELDSWQLQGFGESKISPHISVFTNLLPDHLNYYKGDPPASQARLPVRQSEAAKARALRAGMKQYFADKANIFRFQTKNDFAVVGKEIAKRIKTRGKKIIAKPIPLSWKFNLPGSHNKENGGLAVEALKVLGISEKEIKNGLASFPGVPGRLELIRELRRIKFYNDTTSTTPDAGKMALKALGNKNELILIMGGADKKLDMSSLIKMIPKYCKKVVLLPGTGTDNLPANFKNKCIQVKTLKEAVSTAILSAQKGDTILLSPGFASFGLFKNEFDRGDKFNKIVKSLK
jgi:UDP-N-acetylmuramoylalanine--D-glutamate ligase